ncbi:ROK family protein [Paenibacillus cymbidii]|uniref:ROK family protein n=1 Tax=Paenibacillus cymbidii TaxID=1639034 RepID=UPI001081FCD1|nr:ROK family protein [Paenibacillus cymbidii]
MERGTPQTISRMNKKLIVRSLLQHGPTSRADLVKRLNMSFPSLSANVRELLAHGLLYEGSAGNTNSIGRNSTLVCVNEHFRYAAGINAELGHFQVAVADFAGTIIHYEEVPSKQTGSMMEIAREIVAILGGIDGRFPGFLERLAAVALGMHGVKSEARAKNYLHLKNDPTDIEAELTKRLSARVIVDNDVNMAVLGEKWNHLGDRYEHIVFVNIDDGIGAGIILGNELFRGSQNAAGELGNMLLDPAQCLMEFKEEGALETLVFGRDDGDEPNGDLLSPRRIAYIAMMLVNLICMLNPQLVIIGGRHAASVMRHRAELERILEKHTPVEPPPLIESQAGRKAAVYGALSVALEQARGDALNQL